ncbi:Hypothetical predicted protein [Cloeon dipterum]|uniref:Ionotropic glutamate receptor C-terminal domain-containing protein n=2 Tax=Cloeon dipterum TaxID=197152 RepID=A0A8S1CI30_9INSE|nr:Hypothetical predicted protein [Cloeon dipterum]
MPLLVLACCLLISLFAPPLVAQVSVDFEFIESEWRLASSFFFTYHSQWPIRRVVVVYVTAVQKQEAMQQAFTSQMFQDMSNNGISVSYIKLPNPRPIAALRLDNESQPPITCMLLLTPTKFTSEFVRAASDAGGMSGSKIQWIYVHPTETRALSASNGLRPDTKLLNVVLNEDSTITLQQWTGASYTIDVVWSGPSSSIPTELAVPPNYNLSGIVLSVAVFHDPPFVILTNVTRPGLINPSQVNGWLVDVWYDLQNILLFETRFYTPKLSTSVTKLKASVDELQTGRADVVLAPFVVTISDFDLAEYSMPIADIRFRFLLPREKASSSIEQFLQPFELFLWRMTLAVLTVAVALLTISYSLGRYFEYENPHWSLFNLKESLLVIYGSLFAQGHDYVPNSLASRMIIWLSYIFGVVIVTSYGAALITKLTLGTVEPPFRTFEEMLESDYTAILLPDSAPIRLMQAAERGAWNELRVRKPYPVTLPNLADSLTEVQKSWAKYTLLESRERVLPLIQYPPENCKLTMLPTDVFKAPGQLMLSKSSPYKAAIDQQLIMMRGCGRLDRMQERWMGLVYDDPCPRDSTLPQFGMDNVMLPFLIMACSLGLAVVLLIAEILIKRWCGKLLAEENEEGELAKIARIRGIRLSKGWRAVQRNLGEFSSYNQRPRM